MKQGLLPQQFRVIAVDRRDRGADAYRKLIDSGAEGFVDKDATDILWQELLQRIHYFNGDFQQPDTYTRMATLLDELENSYHTGGNCLFYLATPPGFFGDIAQQLKAAGLATERDGQWRHLVVEKPFGRDLQSARALNKTLQQAFDEDQIYRIDHYLGKETVQNILIYRFPIVRWNRSGTDATSITSRSQWLNPSAWELVAATMTRPAPCAI